MTRCLPAWSVVFSLAFTLALSASCGGDDDTSPPDRSQPDDDPFGDYIPDPDLFFAAVDFDDDAQATDFLTQRVALNQLVLVMTEDYEPSNLEGVVEALGGTIVGQVPDLGFFQVAIDASTLTSLEQAMLAAEGWPDVEATGFNHAMTAQESPDYCHAKDDLHAIEGTDRCAPRDIDYFQMVPIVEELKKIYTLRDVRVAVIDTGVQQDVGEFDSVSPILNLNHKGWATQDLDGHGTQVAGVIAADNGDGGVNGIASRALGDHLKLLAGTFDSSFSYAAIMRRALNAKADVVNMSWGTNFKDDEGLMAVTDNLIYQRIFLSAPQTFFAISAGNENTIVTPINYSPIGNRTNTFMVGGSAACNPDQRWVKPIGEGMIFSEVGSNYGPLVDLSAPGEHVPLIRYEPSKGITAKNNHEVLYDNGTSVAAPQVAALAAILKSFDPTLTGAKVRDYIFHHSFPGAPEFGGGRLVLPLAIEQLVIDSSPSAEVTKLIDADESPGEWDVPAVVVNRICGGAEFTISGHGTARYSPNGDQAGGMHSGALFLIFVDDAGDDVEVEDQTLISINITGEFILQLYEEILIPVPVSVAYYNGPAGSSGSGTAGYVNFTECAITERAPDSSPFVVELGGVVEGGLDIITPPSAVVENETIDGTFSIPVGLNNLAEAQLDAIEANCVGGIELE